MKEVEEMEKAIEIILLTAWQRLDKIDFLNLFTICHGIKFEPQKDIAFEMCAISYDMLCNGQY